jgi:hypothetical protein
MMRPYAGSIEEAKSAHQSSPPNAQFVVTLAAPAKVLAPTLLHEVPPSITDCAEEIAGLATRSTAAHIENN